MIVPTPVGAAALPLDDPQFWIATAMVAAAGLLALRRVLRHLRAERATPCASCPAARLAAGAPPPPARRRLPVLPAAALALALAPAAAPAERVGREVATMGTTLRVEVEAPARDAALGLAEQLVRAVESAERRLSTWRDDSELAALERAPLGAPVALSPATHAELAAALRCAEETGGAFDPTVGPLVRAWGLRTGGRRPSESELERALAEVGAGRLRLAARPPAARKSAPLVLEEGGFGKGAALDAALDAAGSAAAGRSVRLDLGGQLAWAGAGPGTVELADPRRRSRAAIALELGAAPGAIRGSLASSGTSERGAHVIDPRTGRPAADFGSVAVLDRSALRADCLSTALYVLGPDRGLAWLAERGRGAEAVFLVVEGERLRARASSGLAGRLRAVAPDPIPSEGKQQEAAREAAGTAASS